MSSIICDITYTIIITGMFPGINNNLQYDSIQADIEFLHPFFCIIRYHCDSFPIAFQSSRVSYLETLLSGQGYWNLLANLFTNLSVYWVLWSNLHISIAIDDDLTSLRSVRDLRKFKKKKVFFMSKLNYRQKVY